MKRTGMAVNNKGFSLIQFLLVAGIIGVLLAVIIPMAIRANINSKLEIVDKNAAEVKSYAVQWAEMGIRSQDEANSTATLIDYYASLATVNGLGDLGAGSAGQQWIATTGRNNWNINEGTTTNRNKGATEYISINGRVAVYTDGLRGPPSTPEFTVEHPHPPEKAIKNPFNGVPVFRSQNYPPGQGKPVPGALAFGFVQEPAASGGWFYFALAYQGTDSTTYDFSDDKTTFDAGSGLLTIPALKNGELFARIRDK